MSMEFDNIRPIYIQIIEEIKQKIISGYYKCNEQLPSVRNLAVEYKVNPNTVQRAYQELEYEKLVYTDRTNGRFVTENTKIIENLKIKIIEEKIEIFLNNMNNLGIAKEEIINCLKNK